MGKRLSFVDRKRRAVEKIVRTGAVAGPDEVSVDIRMDATDWIALVEAEQQRQAERPMKPADVLPLKKTPPE